MKAIKQLFCLSLILFVTTGYSPVEAQLMQSDKELGNCGSLGPDQKKQELCESYDNQKERCEKESGCSWTAKQKVCGSNRNRPPERDIEFCEQFRGKNECLDNSLKCDWGYKKPTCNAINSMEDKDVSFCENLDSSEAECKRNADRCDWS